jgi:hypothetical protein
MLIKKAPKCIGALRYYNKVYFNTLRLITIRCTSLVPS